jgi:uncharacterized protein (DUF3084 family)
MRRRNALKLFVLGLSVYLTYLSLAAFGKIGSGGGSFESANAKLPNDDGVRRLNERVQHVNKRDNVVRENDYMVNQQLNMIGHFNELDNMKPNDQQNQADMNRRKQERVKMNNHIENDENDIEENEQHNQIEHNEHLHIEPEILTTKKIYAHLDNMVNYEKIKENGWLEPCFF